MQALHDVVQAGYVRYIGMSSCWAWQCKPLLLFLFHGLVSYIVPVHAMQSELVMGCLCLPIPLSEYLPDYAINHKLTPFISMQNHYSLIYREEEREMFPTLKVLARDGFHSRI